MKFLTHSKTTIHFIALFVTISSYGQILTNYQGLKSQGTIPKDFVQYGSDKYLDELNNQIESEENKKLKKRKADFVLSSSYEIRDFLYSGRVIFNDTLSVYLESIKKKLLIKNPELMDSLRFYTVKSSSTNGFATNDGMIFINIGLIARVKSEAQLAFVLAHEISHFRYRHVINSYLEGVKIETEKVRTRTESTLSLKNKYSRELETEADRFGFELYANAGYNVDDVESIFDMLKYSYLPVGNEPFDKKVFENGHYKFPDIYWNGFENMEKIDSTEEETESTHPSIEKRKEQIKFERERLGAKGGLEYQANSKDYFKLMVSIARFELCKVLIYERKYVNAVYHIFLLKQKFKRNVYLDRMMTMALYYNFLNSINSKFELFDKMSSEEKQRQGESYALHFLFDAMSATELGILALRYSELQKAKYPSEGTFNKVTLDILYRLKRDLELPDELFTDKMAAYNDTTCFEDYRYVLNAFDDVNIGYEFHDVLKNIGEVALMSNLKFDKREVKDDSSKDYKREQKRIDRYGKSFGIDKVVVVDPDYNKIDSRKKKSYNYFGSEESLIELEDNISYSAEMAGVQVEVLSRVSLSETETEKFNDMLFLNSWIKQSLPYLEDADTSFFVQIERDEVDVMRDKYDTDIYCWSGFTSIREKKKAVATTLIVTAIYFPMFPYGVYYSLTPDYSTYFYVLFFDIKKNKMVWVRGEEINDKDNKGLINSIFYDTFSQIK